VEVSSDMFSFKMLSAIKIGIASLGRESHQFVLALLICATVAAFPARANGVGENYSWQFMSSTDKANRAFIEELRQRKKSGAYAPPVYNTVIDRQFNCNVTATSKGNEGVSSTVAASPSTTGNNSQAKANESQNGFDLFGFPNQLDASGTQTNAGSVLASTSGGVQTKLAGNTSEQVINSSQTNTAAQTANVDGSTACSFGALN
jgi:hypothetical protein